MNSTDPEISAPQAATGRAIALMANHRFRCSSPPDVIARQAMTLHWDRLPTLPDHEGFASPFAGASGGALIRRRRRELPRPAPVGRREKKTWYDSVFALEQPAGVWKIAGPDSPAPPPTASPSTRQTASSASAAATRPSISRERLPPPLGERKAHDIPLPSLPQPCAFMSARPGRRHDLRRRRHRDPGCADVPEKRCGRWDLRQQPARWQELEPLPRAGTNARGGGSGGRFHSSYQRHPSKPGP